MQTQQLIQSQQKVISANPRTTASNPAAAFNFSAVSSDPTKLQIIMATGPNPNPDPKFTIRPTQAPFFGVHTVTVTMSGLKGNFQPAITPQTFDVQITGSLPDDGTPDHFEPTAGDPEPIPA